jgi:hypothetical protein
MEDLRTNIQKEESGTRWMWDTTNSCSGNTGIVYKYKIVNDGFDLDAEIDKYEIQPFGNGEELFDMPTSSVYQECKVRYIKHKKYPTLFLEKKKAIKEMNKGEGNLYTNLCTDLCITFKVTQKLLDSSNQCERWLPACSSSDLNNEFEWKDVYELPIKFGSKKLYN